MLKINIMTQLLAFFTFAIVLNTFRLNALLPLLLGMLALLGFVQKHQFYRMVKRIKWVYLIMLIIFAFNTPGEHVHNWPFDISPTYEGVQAGFTQLLRITVMLASLSLLLAVNTTQRLISGFYFMLAPLKYLGLNAERFAARLWLTLHYVETQENVVKIKDVYHHLTQNLSGILNETQHEEIVVRLEKPIYKWGDIILIMSLLACLGAILFRLVK